MQIRVDLAHMNCLRMDKHIDFLEKKDPTLLLRTTWYHIHSSVNYDDAPTKQLYIIIIMHAYCHGNERSHILICINL